MSHVWLFAERVVQDGAAEAGGEGEGMSETEDHQPLLLRPMQLVLHTEEQPSRHAGRPTRGDVSEHLQDPE